MTDVVQVEVSISDELSEAQAKHVPTPKQFQTWCSAAYGKSESASIDIRIVDNDESQALNRKYRGKDKPTNVLSFPMEIPFDVGVNVLGDMAIAVDVVEQEAKEQDKSPQAHWAHMTVHGVLHLLGYDHLEDEEAESMEQLEREILAQLGYSDPYLIK